MARLGEPLVQVADLGDDAAQRDGTPAAVALDEDALVELDVLAVRVDHPVLEVELGAVEVVDGVLELSTTRSRSSWCSSATQKSGSSSHSSGE